MGYSYSMVVEDKGGVQGATVANTANETRVRNIALMYCIKY